MTYGNATKKSTVIAAALVISGAACARDPSWVVGMVDSAAGGLLTLTNRQNSDCNGELYVVVSASGDGHNLNGCWKFSAQGNVQVIWTDGDMRIYPGNAFKYSDWFLANLKAQAEAQKGQPKIEHKSNDITS